MSVNKSIQNPLYLVGMPGSGKTIVGRLLAERLGVPFTDVDEAIMESSGKSITAVFKEEGEMAFRAMELAWAEQEHQAGVYATGGGLPCFHDNMSKLLKKGDVIYLKTSIDDLQRRLSGDTKRPLVSGLSQDELRAKITTIHGERNSCYSKASLIVNTDEHSPAQLVEKIIEELDL